MKYIKIFIIAFCFIVGVSGFGWSQTNGNPTTSGKFVLKNDAGNALTLSVPTSGVTNYTLTLPAINGGLGGMLYLTNGTGSFGWLAAGTNGQVLSISGGIPTWSSGASGTVTSVGLTMPAVLYSSVTNSPITSSGTLIPQLATQAPTFVFAGPVSGANATPTFRALVATDIPSGSTNYIQNSTTLQASSNYNISGNGTIDGQLQLKGTGTGITTFQAGAQGVTNINYTLPITAPTAGQILSSSNTGVLSWINASTGTVTSVGLTMPAVLYSSVTNSPITSSGTLIPQLATQAPTFVFAGPVSGANATPTFRALVATDIPSGSTNYIQNSTTLQASSNYNISGNGTIDGQLQLKGTGTGITTFQAGAQGATNINYTLPITAPTAGQILNSTAAGVLSWTNGSTGTVTSVGLAMPSIFTVTNSPVTSSGTLTASLNTQNANLFFAGPSTGAAVMPTFRAITPADLNGSGWSITGNSGTMAGTNFIGTTDNADFVTKVFNTERARIRASDGFMTLGGNFTPSAPLHIQNANSGHATLFLQNTAIDGYSSIDFLNDVGTTVNVGTSNSGAGAFPNQFYFNVSAGTTVPITFNQQTVEKMAIDVNGNVYITNNLGVGTTTMKTKVDIDGGLSIRPTTPGTISSSGQITVGNRSYIRITHDGTAATYTMTLTNGLQDGQVLIIQSKGIDGTHPFKFADGGTLVLSGDFVPNTNNSTISLIWDGAEWVETARSLN